MKFVCNSRRSEVYSTKGIVASTQPLASAAGIRILEKGGNCVDASVAVSACLAFLEPASTGIGGDCYLLFYDNKEKKVLGLNGTGRSASALSLDYIKENSPGDITKELRLKPDSIFSVNVPGAIAGWCDAVDKWGSGNVTMADILQPAIDLAQGGAGISPVSAALWKRAEKEFKEINEGNEEMEKFLPNMMSPVSGQLYKNPDYAKSLKKIAQEGKDGFYKGETGKAIVKVVQQRGGLITEEDLANHKSTFVEPISLEILGKKLWEIPPNGSGIVALMCLGMFRELANSGDIKLEDLKHNSTEYLHLLIETLKIGFKVSDDVVNDPDHFYESEELHLKDLNDVLSPYNLKALARNFKNDQVLDKNQLEHNVPNKMFKSDTVYHTCTDIDGNACSFINSVYESFGSKIIVPGTGFTLNNRGNNFNCNPESRNCIGPNKRSYHTIIPGMITSPQLDGTEELYATYGIMGGFNQPQAHVQVFFNMLLFGMNPQEALDMPRLSLAPHPDHVSTDYKVGADGPASRAVTLVNIEEGVDPTVIQELTNLGHLVHVLTGFERSEACGRGQVIRKDQGFKEGEMLLYCGGSDLRGDGAAIPQI